MVRAIGSAWASRVTDFANLTRIVGAMPTLAIPSTRLSAARQRNGTLGANVAVYVDETEPWPSAP
jgi:hypothetical protein